MKTRKNQERIRFFIAIPRYKLYFNNQKLMQWYSTAADFFNDMVYFQTEGNVLYPQLKSHRRYRIFEKSKPIYLSFDMRESDFNKMMRNPITVLFHNENMNWCFANYTSTSNDSTCRLISGDISSDQIKLSELHRYKAPYEYCLLLTSRGKTTLLMSKKYFEEKRHCFSFKEYGTDDPFFMETIKQFGKWIEIKTLLRWNYECKPFMLLGPHPKEGPILDEGTTITGCFNVRKFDKIIEYNSYDNTLKIYHVFYIGKQQQKILYVLDCTCTNGVWDIPYPSDRELMLWNKCQSLHTVMKEFDRKTSILNF